jgi:hypothetical protein
LLLLLHLGLLLSLLLLVRRIDSECALFYGFIPGMTMCRGIGEMLFLLLLGMFAVSYQIYGCGA